MTRGNRAILEHRKNHMSIRLFDGATGVVTYRGELAIDEHHPFHRMDGREKDTDAISEIIVFHLHPIAGLTGRGAGLAVQPAGAIVEEVAPEAMNVEAFLQTPSAEPREADRRESKLVSDFRAFCKLNSMQLVRQSIAPPGEQSLFTDLFDKTRNLLIEAKGSVTRDSIRLAIGQLLDYRRFFNPTPDLAVLVPARPREDLIALLHSLQIAVIFRHEESFEELSASVAKDGACS